MASHTSNGGKVELDHPSIVVADDDVAHRRGVRETLTRSGFVVAAESGDAETAVNATMRLKPDILLLEIELPGDGLSAIGKVVKASPKTLIVVLSRSERPEDVVTALTRGASGYLLKGTTGDLLAATLRGAYDGEPPLSRSLVPHLVEEIRRGSERRLLLPDGAVTLTPREWEVGELLRERHSTAEIADRLGVSPVTVRRHVGLLLHKLGANSREAAVDLLRTYGRR
jgi:DNA-binding NarL/FixJ family response regulator